MSDKDIDIIPQSGDHMHGCTKLECFYCYEMNRIKQPHPESKFVKKTTYQHRKQKQFKEIFAKYKAA